MFRALFVRRTDWTVFVLAAVLSISLMLLEGRAQARVAWFVQHTLLAPVEIAASWLDRAVATYWENKQLRQALTRARIEADAVRAERQENVRLRELLDLTQRAPYAFIASHVAGRSLDRLGGTLTLDKGIASGIRPNSAVVTPDGLVGRVERATEHRARVLTLLHRDCAVAARVDRSRVDGVLQWEFGVEPMLHLLYVPRQEDVREGDRVLTSGLGGRFPAGILIGTVMRVEPEPAGLMKAISVRPAVDFRSLEEVLVYLPSNAPGVAPETLWLEAESAPESTLAGPAAAPASRPATPEAGP